MPYTVHIGPCLRVLRTLPDNSVDSVVTDPPYGLSDHKPADVVACLTAWLAGKEYRPNKKGFMGRTWDSWVPGPEVWREAFRVLKPGGHVVAFAGSRTHDLMSMALRLAGFECRDTVMWVYGCLSEDSEVLTPNGWERYDIAKTKNILVYDIQNDVYKWEAPARWNEYRVDADTAYRIQSDNTDQIVSRGHRCLVERGGELAFVAAEELSGVERVPYLQGDFSALPQGRGELLLETVLRQSEGLAQAAFSEWQGQEAARERACWRNEPCVEGRADLLQAQGEVSGSVDQVRPLSGSIHEHGPQGRVCDGAPACCCDGDWQAADAQGVRASHQPRCDGQQAGEPDAVYQQCRSQEVRARASYRTTVATVTPIEYSGLIWCPTVSTGAFVARRNGKVFITGNSGFPKSMDVSKAIDKAAGVDTRLDERWVPTPHPVTGAYKTASGNSQQVGQALPGLRCLYLPASPSARQWSGWGTALKPAMEPITVARKPLDGTVADNVLRHGTGAINVDGCRVVMGDEYDPSKIQRQSSVSGSCWSSMQSGIVGKEIPTYKPGGRWPANLIHDGSDEATGLLDSAARFFYCPKASKADRESGLDSIEIVTVQCSSWENADHKARLRVDTAQSPPRVIAVSGAPCNDARAWNMLLFGSPSTVPCLLVNKSTIETATNSTTESRTLNWLVRSNTSGCTAVASCETEHGGSLAESAEFGTPSLTITSEWTVSARGVERVQSPMRLSISGNAGSPADHPTVKPTDLMRYLCRLVTPPNGIVIDPFMGSGSTGKAATLEGFHFIGIEREEAYCEIAAKRIQAAERESAERLVPV